MGLESISYVITAIILIVGAVFLALGTHGLLMLKKSQRVEANVTNYTQEYTTRGFLWKANVEYEIDGKKKFYTTRARTTQRGSDTKTLYITNKGKIIERNFEIERICFGAVAVVVAIVLFVAL